ncbi:hypothetical protein H8356DRAFT_1684702 [Neocallimastix lanati (nom. inval.)]|jgi:hypothetical protein|uniref:Uncharacterized protein n=1 Tax=Neocallimastix californiae TaxID=1754190 RepID=A0A1Y2AVQ3_9FUNG|nr:hypothetical protein H8356DRAFT_1684702 [Neocallimastix sp. JGI-2020a]ORY26534.1 hypothetical protein LY90DRAFT_674548 [Neocallimastix californiae]|eukprot:ORY26534.1 hypothetical protein LY90DRAFT_674548 [Neocallimastix californiae]
MNNSNIDFKEISNFFLEFLIDKSRKPVVNNTFNLSIISQLLENEPILKENSEVSLPDTCDNNTKEDSPNSHELNVIYYRNQLLDILENEFSSINETVLSSNFPLLQKFENPLSFFQKGLPSKPYYKVISYIISQWSKLRKFPYTFIDHNMPNEIEEYTTIKDELNKRINTLNSDLQNSINNKKNIYWNFFEKLSTSDLLVLLGERITYGSSKEILPPSINDCIKAFIEIHPNDKKCKKYGGLTVGARALSKHCHRDQTNKWWGDYTGNTLNKNNLSISIIIKLLKSISWINIHKLPHDINVYEIRNIQGYGARWYFTLDFNTLDPIMDKENDIDINKLKIIPDKQSIKYNIEFRGFLEPQDIHGHENRWRH